MRFKYSLFVLILFLFFNMAVISAKDINNESFYNLENSIVNESYFEENGLKVQFKINKNINSEQIFLKEYLIYELKGKYTKVDDKSFNVSSEDIKACINLWEADNYTYVEINLINTNSKYNTKHLEEIVENITKNKVEDVQIFLYYKGRIDNDKSLNDFNDLTSLTNLNMLSISNGYTGTGISELGEKMNFALVSYNDRSYIIIGTPIIFTTY
ncbi:hypothetical protein JW813_02360 [Clostridium botulinum]|uniref:hypothetical protein n=1 Tax=Clostridium botulinum TaxID=1491 RepID=UPI00144F0CE4|nr:hypothetical protein [Clostridium botulinum]NFO03934.1 hypothetical protein [Clostridium botulinum]UZP03868.1 hypothetical protein JW813_02360 [Clostridium botulinum]UZP07224.1 hypothetical protein JYA71_02355 [Clostridium botulinum]UZP10606.1 hypothetical protein JYA74_02355 [Clostridium botulinum]